VSGQVKDLNIDTCWSLASVHHFRARWRLVGPGYQLTFCRCIMWIFDF